MGSYLMHLIFKFVWFLVEIILDEQTSHLGVFNLICFCNHNMSSCIIASAADTISYYSQVIFFLDQKTLLILTFPSFRTMDQYENLPYLLSWSYNYHPVTNVLKIPIELTNIHSWISYVYLGGEEKNTSGTLKSD